LYSSFATFRRAALRPTLAWFERAPGQALDAGEKTVGSERPARVLGGAQASEHIRFRLAGKQIGEAREASLIGASAVTPFTDDKVRRRVTLR
jgi:hypothetical protein